MKIKDFGVEIWMNLYENNCKYNLAETCVESLTINELLSICENGEEEWNNIRDLKMTYGDIEGSDRIKNAISTLYNTVKLENLIVTHGTISANALTIMSIVEREDKVISVLPTYQQHYSIPESIGADVHFLYLKEEDRFLPNLNELKKIATKDTKIININNPNNPTGSVIPAEMMKEIVEIAKNCGAYLLCDEAYRGLTHEGESFSVSPVDLYEKGISTSGMTKTFSLAGLRLGWVAGPVEIIEKVSRQRDYHVISVGIINDRLAALALENKEKIVSRNLKIVRGNAKMLDEFVNNEPLLSYVKPQGGTTAFLKYNIDMPSVDLCEKLLEQTGVMLLPGSAFDMEGWLRIGYCNNPEIEKEGMREFSRFLKQFEVK